MAKSYLRSSRDIFHANKTLFYVFVHYLRRQEEIGLLDLPNLAANHQSRRARVRHKCGNACNLPPQNQSVYVMSTLISVHRLEVVHVPNDVVLITDAIAAEHVPSAPRDVQRFATAVTLDQ